MKRPPRALVPSRRTLTRRAQQAGVLAALALAAPAQFVPDDFAAPLSRAVVLPGELAPGRQFTAAVSGLLNADEVPDVAVLADGVVHVLINPGLWSSHVALPSAGVRDLALLPRASSLGDGLVTADASGVLLWRWQESAPRGFVAHALGSGIQDPQRVFTAAQDIYPEPSLDELLVGVLDGTTTVHCLRLLEGGAPEVPPATLSPLTPWTLPATPQDLAWFDPFGFGQNLLAVSDSTGLRVYVASGGSPFLTWPASVASSYLTPIEDDPGSGLARRVAWVRKLVGNTNHKVQVAGVELAAGVLEPPGNLGVGDVTGVSAGAAHAAAADDPVGQADLVLGRADGTAFVRLNDGGDPGSVPSTTTSFVNSASFSLVAAPALLAPWTSLGRPLLADFDADGWDDVLRWDDAEGAAKLCLRLPGGPEEILPNGLALVTDTIEGDHPLLVVNLDTPAYTHAQLIVWEGTETVPSGEFELVPSSLEYEAYSHGESMTSLIDSIELDGLDLSQVPMPPFLAVELRLRNAGRPVGTQVYLVTGYCDVYFELVCIQGNPGFGPPQDPVGGQACDDCQPAPFVPPAGHNPDTDLLDGVMPVGQLPPFQGNAIPVINV